MITHGTMMKIMGLRDRGMLTLGSLTPILEGIRNEALEEAAIKMIAATGSETYANVIRALKSD